jgi:hypothetical protein
MDEQKLLVLLADWVSNPDYDYIAEVVTDYNNSGQEKAILQEYDSHTGSHLFCVL